MSQIKNIENAKFPMPEIKVSYINALPKDKRIHLTGSEMVYEYLKEIWNMDTIELEMETKAIYLTSANDVIGFKTISLGSLTSAPVNQPVLFGTALTCAAKSVILAYNCPSGQLKTGRLSEQMAAKLKEAAKLLDISLLDIIIVTKESYLSYADQGILF